MLARAERKRSQSRVPVELKQMDVTRLEFPVVGFDAAIATFLFCVLPVELQVSALRELSRVVKPGRPIRLLEYVHPHRTLRGLIARTWEPWMAWAYGPSFDRHTEEHIPEAGLTVVSAQ